LFGWGAGFPYNTIFPGTRPAFVPSYQLLPTGILVHPAVWPQRTLTEN